MQRLKSNGFRLIDCQIPSDHLKTLGAKIMPREEFITLVKKSTNDCKCF